jgi:hypothetical protein
MLTQPILGEAVYENLRKKLEYIASLIPDTPKKGK